MHAARRLWTDPEETAALVRMWNDGVPIRKIGEALNRKKGSVEKRCKTLGLAKRLGGDKDCYWAAAELATVRAMWEGGSLVADIMAAIAPRVRTSKAITDKMREIDAIRLKPEAPPLHPPVDIAKLREMWPQYGINVAQIAAALGCSQKRMYKLVKAHDLGRRPTKPVQPRKPRVKPVVVALPPPPPPPPPKPVSVPDIIRRTPATIGRKDCQWPIGHPGEPGFGYCGCPAVTGRPYCAGHIVKAYRQPGSPDEQAGQANMAFVAGVVGVRRRA